MVDGINQPKPATQHSVLKLKGKDGQTIDLNKLKGLKETKENEALFKKYDSNGDHIIDEKEALAMRNNLQSIAGNGTISKREIGKHFGKEAFEALNSLAEQQKAQKQETGQTEKSADGYTSVKNQDGSITYIMDDGSKETRFPDGKKVYTKPDGSTITHTSDGNKTIMRDTEGNITSTIELTKDGREIRTEYETDGNKTIARSYDGTGKDAPLDSITVSEKQNGHNIDTKYASEEDMKNGRPSEQIRDAQNPTLKTITKFTYDDKGNIKAETTDSAGKQTIKYTDANGKEIASEQFDIPEGVNGGELPEVLVEAKAPTQEAKELRQQLAQMYGDSFEVGYAKDGTIEIRNPDGSINENLTAQANNQLKDNTLLAGAIDGGVLPEVVVEAKAPTEEAKQLRQQLAQMYGDSFEVGYAKDGTIEIRNPDGSINENLTAQANNQLKDNTLLAGAINGGELPEVVIEAKAPTEEAKQLRQQLAQMYGDSFEVGYAKDGTIEIRNPDGSINENLTAQANNQLNNNTLLAGAIDGGVLPEVVIEAKAPTEEAKQLRQQLAQMYGDSFEVGYAKDGTIEIRNPDGSINENLTAQANNQLNNNTLLAGAIDGGVLPEVVIEAKAPTQEAKELRQQLAQILGDNYEVGYAKDGTLEIRNTDGSVNENLTADANVMLDKEPLREQLAQVLGDNYDVEIAQDGNFIIRDKKTGEILKEATENANDMNATTDQEDIETIMAGSDVINKDGHIDKKEYNNFINSMLESAGFEITDNNREQIQKMIENSFTSLDSINADGKVTMEELQANAKEVIQKLTDDLLAATDISENPEEPV